MSWQVHWANWDDKFPTITHKFLLFPNKYTTNRITPANETAEWESVKLWVNANEDITPWAKASTDNPGVIVVYFNMETLPNFEEVGKKLAKYVGYDQPRMYVKSNEESKAKLYSGSANWTCPFIKLK